LVKDFVFYWEFQNTTLLRTLNICEFNPSVAIFVHNVLFSRTHAYYLSLDNCPLFLKIIKFEKSSSRRRVENTKW